MAMINPPSFEKVDKRETTHEGELTTKKAKHIKIGGHTEYPYSNDAVMNGSRGSDSSSAYTDPWEPAIMSLWTQRNMASWETVILLLNNR